MVLSDGATGRIRPITPEDHARFVAFYERVGEESKYYRFFAPRPHLSDTEVRHYTTVDYDDRVALIVTVGDRMIAVGRYDRLGTGSDEAEVAFLVEDAHHGRGLGSVLLEHLAQAARERGVRRFLAEVLPANRKMIQVFTDAGYRVTPTYEDGILHVEFDIDPTEESLEVSAGREHRAESRSIERLLTPRSVAVIGASRQRDKLGQALVRHLVLGGFTGPVYAVNRDASAIAGVPAYPTLADVPGQVDLAIVAIPAESVPGIVADASTKGVRGLVVVSAGFADADLDERRNGRVAQDELVDLTLRNGIRLLGPNCLGLVNTDPAFSLNASTSAVMPGHGRVGFFSQSGALGQEFLRQCVERGLGLSTFVSAGNRADVSGNDLLQYWESDEGTDVVLLYLESIGNPRKFARVARRLTRSTPVVAVRAGRHTQGVPMGHTVGATSLPARAVDELFRQAGVVLVDTVAELFDVAQVLAYQPLPAGQRVAVVGNSDALCRLAADAALSAGLDLPQPPRDLGPEADADDFAAVLDEVVDSPLVDAVVVVFAPRLEVHAPQVAEVLAAVAVRTSKPIVTTFLGTQGIPEPLRISDERGVLQPGSLPSYASPEEAVRALSKAVEYARFRALPGSEVPDLHGIAVETARGVIDNVLLQRPGGRPLRAYELDRLLSAYQIPLSRMVPVASLEAAIEAAEHLGWDVVLKATARHLRARPDLADVWRNIDTPAGMRDAWETMSRTLADAAEAHFVVQKMAPAGVPVALHAVEDPLYGPVLSFGVAGVASTLLGDRAHRMPPLTDHEAYAMVEQVAAAPMLHGYAGADPADVPAIVDLLHRLSALVDDLPEVSELALDPVLVAPSGLTVVYARGRVAPPRSRADWYTRRLR